MNEQLARAHAKAQERRGAMAQAKRDIANGTLSARQVIGDPPEHLRGMKLFALLQAIRSVGSHKAATICEFAGANPLTKLGEMTVRERLKVMDGLDHYPATREA